MDNRMILTALKRFMEGNQTAEDLILLMEQHLVSPVTNEDRYLLTAFGRLVNDSYRVGQDSWKTVQVQDGMNKACNLVRQCVFNPRSVSTEDKRWLVNNGWATADVLPMTAGFTITLLPAARHIFDAWAIGHEAGLKFADSTRQWYDQIRRVDTVEAMAGKLPLKDDGLIKPEAGLTGGNPRLPADYVTGKVLRPMSADEFAAAYEGFERDYEKNEYQGSFEGVDEIVNTGHTDCPHGHGIAIIETTVTEEELQRIRAGLQAEADSRPPIWLPEKKWPSKQQKEFAIHGHRLENRRVPDIYVMGEWQLMSEVGFTDPGEQNWQQIEVIANAKMVEEAWLSLENPPKELGFFITDGVGVLYGSVPSHRPVIMALLDRFGLPCGEDETDEALAE